MFVHNIITRYLQLSNIVSERLNKQLQNLSKGVFDFKQMHYIIRTRAN